MYTWIKNRNIEIKKLNHVDYWDTPEHKRHPTLELKLSVIRRYFEDGEDIKSVLEETNYLKTSSYLWKKYVVEGTATLVDQKKLPWVKLVWSRFKTGRIYIKNQGIGTENDILKEIIKIKKINTN